MVVSSRWTAPMPECSVPTWVFGSSFGDLPEDPQFIDAEQPDTHVLTRSGYRLWCKRLALGLQRAGLKPGERVLLFSGNTIFAPVIFMGVLMAGGVFTGANPGFVPRELAYQLKDSGASFLIATDSRMEVAIEAAAEAGLSRDRIYSVDGTTFDVELGKARLGTKHWLSLLAPKDDGLKFDWVEPSDTKATTCCLNYSSGTTGTPKGVQISHYSYVANGSSVVYVAKQDSQYEEKRRRARELCILPIYHPYGQTLFACIFPMVGHPVYIMPAFDLVKMLKHIQEYRITALTCIPPFLLALAKHPAARKYDLSSIETISSGAAPLGLGLCDEVSKLWPQGAVTVRQGWGMTELTCAATMWHPLSFIRTSAVGEMAPNTNARLMRVDGSAETTEANERGEIWISGPTLMMGYWNNPEATAAAVHVDPDGTRWLKTGDVAYIEKYELGGLWHIVDRIKELIKPEGFQVAPAELEALLLDNEAVADVAVVGVTIAGQEWPRAYVVPSASVKATEEEIAKWIESRAISYKWLRGGVKFIDVIPKSPAGKILRSQLKVFAAKEVGDMKFATSELT
ncbi:hypothetical protein F4809DRAFT_654783 [Biscogniauxia mediterranea]|nr:hypothetical protein F4809DRAFT_654783 [Biscogniauxia mediterranea]